jgi:transcriptional regulator with XRE-family HTH domain
MKPAASFRQGVPVNFGEKVRQLRAERNLTQPQLAQLIGIEQSYLSKLENDKSVPSADIFQAILQAFSTDVGTFLEGIDEKQVYRDLRQVPEVAHHLNSQVDRKIHSIKTWLYASGIALALGLTLGVAGLRGLVFSNTQFNYESPGVLLPGEPTDFFERYTGMLFAQEAAGEISAKERVRHSLEIEKRRIRDNRLLDAYRGVSYTEPVTGGIRTYFFTRDSQFERAANRWLMLAGALLTFSGIAGFIVEVRLRRVRL